MANKTMDESNPSSEISQTRSCSPLFSGWVELNAIENSKVVFLGVRELYSSSQDLHVFFRFISGNEYNEGDIINLTRVGEDNLSKPRCSLDPKDAEDDIGKQKKLVIPSENLPKRTEFYQFLYMRDNVVIGASSPFYLHTSGDDVLAVSSEDDFLVVHQVEMGEEVQEKQSPQPLIGKGQQQKQIPQTDGVEEEKPISVMAKTGTCDSPVPSSPSDSSSVSSTETECSSCASDELSKEKNDLGNEEKESSKKLTTKKLSKYWKRRWYNREMANPMMDNSYAKAEEECATEVGENPSDVQSASKISDEASLLDLSAFPSTSKEKRDFIPQSFGTTVKNAKYVEMLQKMQMHSQMRTPKIIISKTRPELLASEQDQTVTAMKFVLERTTKKYELERKQKELQVETNKTLMTEIKEQDEKLKSLDIELQRVKRFRETSMKEVLTLSCAKNLLEMELKEKVEKIKILEKALEEQCKNNDLSKKNSELLEDLIAEKQRLESTVAAQKSQISKLQEQLEEECKQKQVLKEQVWNLTKENEMIQKQCEGKLSELLRDMSTEREQLYAKIEDLKQDILLLKNQEATLKEAHENLKSKHAEMERESSNIKARIEQGCVPGVSTEDMQQNLAEAAELYRKQFMEILSLRKLVKKLEKRQEVSACKRCSKDDQMSHQSESRASSNSDVIAAPSKESCCAEATDYLTTYYDSDIDWNTVNSPPPAYSKISDDVQFIARIQKSDSDTGEFIKVVEPRVKEDNGCSIQIISMDSLTSGILSARNASTVAAADLCKEEQTLSSAPASVITIPASPRSTIAFDEVSSAPSFITFSPNASNDDVMEIGREASHRRDSTMSESKSAQVSFVTCHHCGLEIPTDGDDLTLLVEHLHESHNQYTCPVCGVAYDATLPIDYYKMHVESHFND